MSDQIHINTRAIQEKVGNALTLKSILDAYEVPKAELIRDCTGRVPVELANCAAEAKNIYDGMQALLNNTIAWCKTVKVSFEKTPVSGMRTSFSPPATGWRWILTIPLSVS